MNLRASGRCSTTPQTRLNADSTSLSTAMTVQIRKIRPMPPKAPKSSPSTVSKPVSISSSSFSRVITPCVEATATVEPGDGRIATAKADAAFVAVDTEPRSFVPAAASGFVCSTMMERTKSFVLSRSESS